MEKELSALDLFGRREAVLERMDKAIRKRFMERSSKWREMWVKDVERIVPYAEKIRRFLRGEIKADYQIYIAFKPSLNLCLGKILGQPNFISQEIGDYWMKQMTEKPMRIVAGNYLHPSPWEREKGLELYVGFRGIGEVARTC